MPQTRRGVEPPDSLRAGGWPRNTLPLLLAAAGAPFGETFLARGVSLADVTLGLACGWTVVAYRGARSRRGLHRGLLVASTSLVVWVLIDAALVGFGSPLAFSLSEFGRSLAKLLFYLGATILLASLAGWHEPRGAGRMMDVFLTVLAINAGVGIYGAVAASTDIGLPYRFLWTASGRGEETSRLELPGGSIVHRIRGVAGEPTYFGWFQATGLGLVLLKGGAARRAFAVRVALVMVSIVGSLSLVGIGVLALALPIVAFSGRRRPRDLLRLVAPAVGLVLAAALVLPSARAALDTYGVDRITGIATGRPDVSSVVHLRGSWELACQVLRVAPWLGSGLGNYDLILDALDARMTGDPQRHAHEIGWNVFAFVIGSLGPLGLLLFLVLMATPLRRDPWAGALILVSAWGTSTVLGAPFWVLYVLSGLQPLLAAKPGS
jgi:hypothetical protein